MRNTDTRKHLLTAQAAWWKSEKGCPRKKHLPLTLLAEVGEAPSWDAQNSGAGRPAFACKTPQRETETQAEAGRTENRCSQRGHARSTTNCCSDLLAFQAADSLAFFKPLPRGPHASVAHSSPNPHPPCFGEGLAELPWAPVIIAFDRMDFSTLLP